MKNTCRIFTIAALLMLIALPGQAQIKKVAQVGFQFLKADVGARGAAMGGAFMLTGYDASSIFYNPAATARIGEDIGTDVFLGQTQWIADIAYNAGAITHKFGTIGTFGLSILAADYGTIEGTVVSDNEAGFAETGDVSVSSFAVGLSYARNLTEKFAVGGQVKFASQNLGSNQVDGGTVENDASGIVLDFGTIFYPGFRGMRFGVSIRNFSQELTYEQESFQLPLTFYMGVAMDMFELFEMDSDNQSFTVSVEATNPRDYTERMHVGGEYWFANLIALRGGYKFNYDEEGLTAGVGFNINAGTVRIKADYAYSDFGVFDSVNRLSVGFSF